MGVTPAEDIPPVRHEYAMITEGEYGARMICGETPEEAIVEDLNSLMAYSSEVETDPYEYLHDLFELPQASYEGDVDRLYDMNREELLAELEIFKVRWSIEPIPMSSKVLLNGEVKVQKR